MLKAYILRGSGKARVMVEQTNITLTEVTAERVKGTRVNCRGTSYEYPTNFNVKRNGDRFALGSGSAKTGYWLGEEVKV